MFRNVAANHTIAATFAANRFTLTVARTGGGAGSVGNTPAGASFPAGTVVTLNAAASPGSTFHGWSGACSGWSPTCQVTMNTDISIGAAFDEGIPRIGFAVFAINVGRTKPGSSVSKTVTVSNNGAGSLDFGALAVTGANAGEFSTSTNCSTLTKHESCRITVSLAPMSFGSKAATLAIPSNDPKRPASTIKVKGMCAPPKISV